MFGEVISVILSNAFEILAMVNSWRWLGCMPFDWSFGRFPV